MLQQQRWGFDLSSLLVGIDAAFPCCALLWWWVAGWLVAPRSLVLCEERVCNTKYQPDMHFFRALQAFVLLYCMSSCLKVLTVRRKKDSLVQKIATKNLPTWQANRCFVDNFFCQLKSIKNCQVGDHKEVKISTDHSRKHDRLNRNFPLSYPPFQTYKRNLALSQDPRSFTTYNTYVHSRKHLLLFVVVVVIMLVVIVAIAFISLYYSIRIPFACPCGCGSLFSLPWFLFPTFTLFLLLFGDCGRDCDCDCLDAVGTGTDISYISTWSWLAFISRADLCFDCCSFSTATGAWLCLPMEEKRVSGSGSGSVRIFFLELLQY